jgi:hypothetical protein
MKIRKHKKQRCHSLRPGLAENLLGYVYVVDPSPAAIRKIRSLVSVQSKVAAFNPFA